jgi:hypothetical protein
MNRRRLSDARNIRARSFGLKFWKIAPERLRF